MVISNSPLIISNVKPFVLELESIKLAISNFFSVSSESLKQRGLTVYDNEFEIKEHTEL